MEEIDRFGYTWEKEKEVLEFEALKTGKAGDWAKRAGGGQVRGAWVQVGGGTWAWGSGAEPCENYLSRDVRLDAGT